MSEQLENIAGNYQGKLTPHGQERRNLLGVLGGLAGYGTIAFMAASAGFSGCTPGTEKTYQARVQGTISTEPILVDGLYTIGITIDSVVSGGSHLRLEKGRTIILNLPEDRLHAPYDEQLKSCGVSSFLGTTTCDVDFLIEGKARDITYKVVDVYHVTPVSPASKALEKGKELLDKAEEAAKKFDEKHDVSGKAKDGFDRAKRWLDRKTR